MREDGDNDRNLTAVGAVCAVLFLGMIVYALVTYGGSKDHGAAAANDPLSQVNPAEEMWSGSKDSTPQLSITMPKPSASATLISAPSPISAPAPRIEPASRQLPSSNYAASAQASGVAYTDGMGPSASVYIEAASFSVAADSGGVPRVIGAIQIVNDSDTAMTRYSLTLRVGGVDYALTPYGGSASHPKVFRSSGLGAHSSLSVSVIASDLDASTVKGQTRDVRLEAWSGDSKSSVTDSMKLSNT